MRTKAPILMIVVGMVSGVAAGDFIDLPVKWQQVPWDANSPPWHSDCTAGQVVADDFLCEEPHPILAARWWGSYPLGTPPVGGPFHISFHYSQGSHPYSVPGGLIALYTVWPQEVVVGVDSNGVLVYRYDAYLTDASGEPEPFDQWYYSQQSENIGELFIDICQPTGMTWGWRQVAPPHPILDFAVWTADGHEGLWHGTETDMAFELMIPEPVSMVLMALGAMGVLARRRRRI